jgi:hypothetical protein
MKTKIIQYFTTNDVYKWYLDGGVTIVNNVLIFYGMFLDFLHVSFSVVRLLVRILILAVRMCGIFCYRIHPMKTKIIQYFTTNDEYKWYLDGNEITTKEDAIHLGNIRSEKNECRRLQHPYRSCHGNQIPSGYMLCLLRFLIWLQCSCYIHFSLILYFLSVLHLGTIPIETGLHKRNLSLLCSMLASDNSKIKEIIDRQNSVSYDNADSFFCSIRDILILFDVPSITDLQANFGGNDCK